MSAAHTPGPWYTGEPFAIFEGADLRFHISQAEGAPFTPHYSDVAQFVAETIPGEKLEIQKANARLIAAAPDLLSALIDLDEAYCDAGRDMNREKRAFGRKALISARAAIAKATGSSNA